MCHGSFTKIVKALTSFDQKDLKAIDYASGILMHGTINLMREIVKNITMEADRLECNKLTCQLEKFLKYDFLKHRGLSSATSNDVSFGIGQDESCNVTCSKCQFPFQIVHIVKKQTDEDAHGLLHNCAEKNSSCACLI